MNLYCCFVLHRDFIGSLARKIAAVRQRFKLNGRELLPVEKYLERITVGQLVEFCDICTEKYQRAKIEPGKHFTSWEN